MNAISDMPLPITRVDPSPVIKEQTGEIGEFLSILWRGKFWITLATLIGMMFGFYHALKLADMRYRSTATVVLDARPDPVVQFSDFLPTMSGDQTIVNTELEVLRSTSLLVDVVRQTNLTEDAEFNPALRPPSIQERGVQMLRDFLDVPAPALSENHDINRTVEGFRRAVTVRNVPDSMVFEITVETGTAEKSAHLSNAIADRYLNAQLETKFSATQDATAWLAEKVAELEVELQHSEQRLSEFSAEMELISPETLEILSGQIKDVRDRISVWDSAVNRGDTSADTAFRLGQLRTLEADLEAKISAQSQDLVVLEQLHREAAADRQIYEYFLTRLKESSVQQGMQQADARILSPALVPEVPSSPKVLASAVLMGVVGAIVMSAACVLKDLRSATFRTTDDLEHATGLRVLGQIPTIPRSKRRDVIEHVRTKPNSAVAEAYRNLRTTLMMSGGSDAPRVILSTSSLPGEGKTTQSLVLAHNLTGVKKRVLVIEGDVRKLVFREYFKAASATHSLIDVMADRCTLDDAVWHSDRFGFDVLFGRETGMNAADIFSSPRFRRMIRQARKSYDAIVIDTPPVLLVPDARVIARDADAVLYTVRWDKTRAKQVAQGLKSFHAVGISVTGLVLSQINTRQLRKYGYGDDYGHYGTSGYYQK